MTAHRRDFLKASAGALRVLGNCTSGHEGIAWVLYSYLHGLDPDGDDVDQSRVETFWESILGVGGDLYRGHRLRAGSCDAPGRCVLIEG
jgi:hypothetical protein